MALVLPAEQADRPGADRGAGADRRPDLRRRGRPGEASRSSTATASRRRSTTSSVGRSVTDPGRPRRRRARVVDLDHGRRDDRPAARREQPALRTRPRSCPTSSSTRRPRRRACCGSASGSPTTAIDAPGPYRSARELLLRARPPSGQARGRPDRAAGRVPGGRGAPRSSSSLGSRLPRHPGAAGLGQVDARRGDDRRPRGAGRRVGVTANSHKVIGTLLDKVAAVRARRAASPSGSARSPPARRTACTCSTARSLLENNAMSAPPSPRARSMSSAGRRGSGLGRSSRRRRRARSSTRPARCRWPTRSRCRRPAEGLVLLGDPQQLDQPLQGSHPPGADRSALGHLLGGAADDAARPGPVPREDVAAPPGHLRVHLGGVLRRAARIRSRPRPAAPRWPGAARRGRHRLPAGRPRGQRQRFGRGGGRDRGLGAGSCSPAGATWRDVDGVVASDRPRRRPGDHAVQRPGRGRSATRSTGRDVGTVDKFQGQEAPVAIYSMAIEQPGGRAARHGVPVQPAPPERGDLARALPGGRRGEPGADPGPLPDAAPDAARQRVCPAGRGRGRAGRAAQRARIRRGRRL